MHLNTVGTPGFLEGVRASGADHGRVGASTVDALHRVHESEEGVLEPSREALKVQAAGTHPLQLCS
jgi:hypothetical protein